MSRARGLRPSKPILLFLAAALVSPLAARAIELDVKFEPGLALSLNKPQSERFGLGGAATVKGLAGFDGGWLKLAAGLTFLGLPAQDGFASTTMGTAWAPSLGLRLQAPRESEQARLQKPHGAEKLFGAKPWFDADLLYVRTGPLDRAGIAAAVGVSFPVGQSRSFWLGPFVRYLQIFNPGRAGFEDADSRTLILGISLETGSHPVVVEPVAAAPAPVAVAAAPVACVPLPDRDLDGVPDSLDNCPDVAGPPLNGGCPVYEKVIVKADKLELKEKIQFEWNTGVIDVVSHPLLNEVAKAMQDNKGFRVSIEGHASSEGADDHNQALSEQRGLAVLEFLAAHGVARDRLVSKGLSSSRPLQSNTTEAGREANRRVEFVVYFVLLNEGNAR